MRACVCADGAEETCSDVLKEWISDIFSTLLELTLTVEGLVLSDQSVLQGPPVVLEQPLHFPAAQRGQVVLHFAGAAGVALRADAEVLS